MSSGDTKKKNKQTAYTIPTKVPSVTKNSKKTPKYSNLQTKDILKENC